LNKELRKKILIAENDITSFTYYKEVLISIGYSIIWAENGSKAVKIFNETKDIDLVITDIEMPILDGYEVTSQIKNLNPEMPIIVLTAYAMKSVKETAERMNCDAFLTKPIRSNELVNAVKKFIK
jgi:CheY-like chemotaxis protein